MGRRPLKAQGPTSRSSLSSASNTAARSGSTRSMSRRAAAVDTKSSSGACAKKTQVRKSPKVTASDRHESHLHVTVEDGVDVNAHCAEEVESVHSSNSSSRNSSSVCATTELKDLETTSIGSSSASLRTSPLVACEVMPDASVEGHDDSVVCLQGPPLVVEEGNRSVNSEPGSGENVEVDNADAAKTDVSFTATAAPILRVSGLVDYFTFGFQAAMTHYANHFSCNEEEREDSANRQEKALERCYRNAYLSTSFVGCDGAVALSVGLDKGDDEEVVYRSSSADTYDSDMDETPSTTAGHPSSPQQQPSVTHTAIKLNPLQTSLYRAPPSTVRSARQQDGPWSASSSASPTAVAPQKEQQTMEEGQRSALWSFQEALRRAYRSEDADRQWRYSVAEEERAQLISSLQRLKGTGPFVSIARKAVAAASTLSPGHTEEKRHSARASPAPSTNLSSLAVFAEDDDLDEADTSRHSTNLIPHPALEPTAAEQNGISESLRDTVAPTARAGSENKDEKSSAKSLPSTRYLLQDVYTVEDPERQDPVLPLSAPGSHPAPRVPQRISTNPLCNICRPSNAFLSTLLRHHEEARQKAAIEHHAAAAAARARQWCELPMLSEDVLRYAAVLLCLRRSSSSSCTPTLTQIPNTAPAPSSPTVAVGTTDVECADAGAVTPAGSEALPPYGEDGMLLYLKYPAPLLRTTAFAVETVRLLRWLRTWKGPSAGSLSLSKSDGRSTTATVGSGVSSPPASPHRGSTRVEGCKRVKVEHAMPKTKSEDEEEEEVLVMPARGDAEGTPQGLAVVRDSPSHATLADLHKEVLRATAVEAEQRQQNKKSAFLHFFGAAAVVNAATTALESSDDKDISRTLVKKESKKSMVQPVSPSTNEVTPVFVGAPSISIHPARYAYQLYTYAWRNVARTGIIPLATATQAFLARRTELPGAAPLKVSTYDRQDPWSSSTVSRACASLPFYREMREEARRTPLGSADGGAYYEDGFGNRLRSARLAKKEQQRLAERAAKQRRRAKKKGYFDRHEGQDGAGAAMMLEAMVGREPGLGSSAVISQRQRQDRIGKLEGARDEEGEVPRNPLLDGDDEDDDVRSSGSGKSSSSSRNSSRSSSSSTHHQRKRNRESHRTRAAEAQDTEELTNIAVVSGPTGAGKTASVYVAAQLLGFRVVEMNTSVKRCCRSVELLLAELTRSHRLSGLRAGPSTVNIEEELARLKQQHAAMAERVRVDEAAAQLEAEQRKKAARKANAISAQAVASFFGCSSSARSKSALVQGASIGAEEESAPAVVVVDGGVPPTASLSGAGVASSTAASTAAVTGRTLLLFDDADVLLGDESMRPFYAAIRDLAHRSKVPIVVTVSSDPSTVQRYDAVNLFSDHSTVTSAGAASFWQLCEAAGLNSRMAALEAAQQTLDTSPASASDKGTIASGGGGDASSGGADHSNGTSPVSAVGQATLQLFFAGSAAGQTSNSATASAVHGLGNGSSFSSPVLSSFSATATSTSSASPAAAAAASSSSASLATRYAHVLLNPALVSSFFGTQTPFTVIGAMPRTALFAQLLAVGAVELGILKWKQTAPEQSSIALKSRGRPGSSSATWQSDLDGLATSLVLAESDAFFALADELQLALFGHAAGESETPSAVRRCYGNRRTESCASDRVVSRTKLTSALHRDAARYTTTDIRYWLNRLQLLLLTLRKRYRSDDGSGKNTVESTEGVSENPGKRPRWQDLQEEMKTKLHRADKERSDAAPPGTTEDHLAERLVHHNFCHNVSAASSAWDRLLGVYQGLVADNEQQSSRYEHWLLRDHVPFASDIIGELHSQDHPTLRLDYTTPPLLAAKISGVLATARTAASPRRGRPPASATTAVATKIKAASDSISDCTSSSKCAAGKTFFGAAAPRASSSSPVASITPPPTVGGSSTIASPVEERAIMDLVVRADWPPSPAELRHRVSTDVSGTHPLNLLLPYGGAADYYTSSAASGSHRTGFSLPEFRETSSAFVGHDVPLRWLQSRSSSSDVGAELPTGIQGTQEERLERCQRWWRRPRKAAALREGIAGRAAGTWEDWVGFSCLLGPSASSSNGAA